MNVPNRWSRRHRIELNTRKPVSIVPPRHWPFRGKVISCVWLSQIGIMLYIHSSYREGLHLKQCSRQKQTSPNAVDIDAHVKIIPASLSPVNVAAGGFSVRWHYSRIVAALASDSKHPHANGCEPDVSLVQLIFKLAFECRSMQKRKPGIYVFKIQGK